MSPLCDASPTTGNLQWLFTVIGSICVIWGTDGQLREIAGTYRWCSISQSRGGHVLSDYVIKLQYMLKTVSRSFSNVTVFSKEGAIWIWMQLMVLHR